MNLFSLDVTLTVPLGYLSQFASTVRVWPDIYLSVELFYIDLY